MTERGAGARGGTGVAHRGIERLGRGAGSATEEGWEVLPATRRRSPRGDSPGPAPHDARSASPDHPPDHTNPPPRRPRTSGASPSTEGITDMNRSSLRRTGAAGAALVA